MSTRDENPKSFIKKKAAKPEAFKSPSRFSGGGLVTSGPGAKSQYRPMPVRITQHKG